MELLPQISSPHRRRNHSRRSGADHDLSRTDFIIARDGRIAALYLFFDKLP
jgi:hypothetical protein